MGTILFSVPNQLNFRGPEERGLVANSGRMHVPWTPLGEREGRHLPEEVQVAWNQAGCYRTSVTAHVA